MKRNYLKKDYKIRKSFQKTEIKRLMLKYFINNLTFENKKREKAYVKLTKFPLNSNSTRIKNRCLFTGRSQSVLRTFRLSRMSFREQASCGNLLGVKKAS